MGKGGWFWFVPGDPLVGEEGAGKERKARFLRRERIEVLVEERRVKEIESKGLVGGFLRSLRGRRARRG